MDGKSQSRARLYIDHLAALFKQGPTVIASTATSGFDVHWPLEAPGVRCNRMEWWVDCVRVSVCVWRVKAGPTNRVKDEQSQRVGRAQSVKWVCEWVQSKL